MEDVKDNGVAISPCHEWLAVLTRRGCVDRVAVYQIDPAPESIPATQRCPQFNLINSWAVPRQSANQWGGDIKRMRFVCSLFVIVILLGPSAHTLMCYLMIGGHLELQKMHIWHYWILV